MPRAKKSDKSSKATAKSSAKNSGKVSSKINNKVVVQVQAVAKKSRKSSSHKTGSVVQNPMMYPVPIPIASPKEVISPYPGGIAGNPLAGIVGQLNDIRAQMAAGNGFGKGEVIPPSGSPTRSSPVESESLPPGSPLPSGSPPSGVSRASSGIDVKMTDDLFGAPPSRRTSGALSSVSMRSKPLSVQMEDTLSQNSASSAAASSASSAVQIQPVRARAAAPDRVSIPLTQDNLFVPPNIRPRTRVWVEDVEDVVPRPLRMPPFPMDVRLPLGSAQRRMGLPPPPPTPPRAPPPRQRAAPNTDRDRYEEMLRQTMMLARTNPREVQAMNRRMAAAGLPPAINPFLLHEAAPSRARIVPDQERVRLLNQRLRRQQIDPTKKYMAVERRDRK